MAEKVFKDFDDFWPSYLNDHRDRVNRRLHFFGSLIGAGSLAFAVAFMCPLWLVGIPVGYAFAWIGHFVVEKNKPTTFSHPLWSLMGDYKMFLQMVTGRIRF